MLDFLYKWLFYWESTYSCLVFHLSMDELWTDTSSHSGCCAPGLSTDTGDCSSQHPENTASCSTGWREGSYQWGYPKYIPKWHHDFRQTFCKDYIIEYFRMDSLQEGHVFQTPACLPDGRHWARSCAAEVTFSAPLSSSSQFQMLVL